MAVRNVNGVTKLRSRRCTWLYLYGGTCTHDVYLEVREFREQRDIFDSPEVEDLRAAYHSQKSFKALVVQTGLNEARVTYIEGP